MALITRRLLHFTWSCVPLTLNHQPQPNFRRNCSNSSDDAKIKVLFRRKSGQLFVGYGKVGDSLLDVIVNNNLDLDGFGACEGTLACSTCHLILKQDDYDRLPKKPSDEELDMLDLAYGLTDTSRLGCQVFLSKDMQNFEVQVPEGINDVRS